LNGPLGHYARCNIKISVNYSNEPYKSYFAEIGSSENVTNQRHAMGSFARCKHVIQPK